MKPISRCSASNRQKNLGLKVKKLNEIPTLVKGFRELVSWDSGALIDTKL